MQSPGLTLGNPPPFFVTRLIGHSQENRPIILHHTPGFAAAPGGTLFVGGMHGDERATVLVLLSFLDRFQRRECASSSPQPALGVLPLANPDGYYYNTRYNARGVDLNRNFGTGWSATSAEPSGSAPWSERESRALRDLILCQQPQRIVTLHWALGELDADGPQSTSLALAMWHALEEDQRAAYRLRVSGSPTVFPAPAACPGSLGQWCGEGIHYADGTAPAIVTLELPHAPHAPRTSALPADHLERLRGAWKRDARAYLEAVEGPVHQMLRAACVK